MLFFTDPERTPHPETVISRLPAGAAVVFRTFGGADVEARGHALATLARRRGVRFIVGADAAAGEATEGRRRALAAASGSSRR